MAIVISKAQIELTKLYRRVGFAGVPTPEQIDKMVAYIHTQRAKDPSITPLLEAEFDAQKKAMLRQFDNNPALRNNAELRGHLETLMTGIKCRACESIEVMRPHQAVEQMSA